MRILLLQARFLPGLCRIGIGQPLWAGVVSERDLCRNNTRSVMDLPFDSPLPVIIPLPAEAFKNHIPMAGKHMTKKCLPGWNMAKWSMPTVSSRTPANHTKRKVEEPFMAAAASHRMYLF